LIGGRHLLIRRDKVGSRKRLHIKYRRIRLLASNLRAIGRRKIPRRFLNFKRATAPTPLLEAYNNYRRRSSRRYRKKVRRAYRLTNHALRSYSSRSSSSPARYRRYRRIRYLRHLYSRLFRRR
jgi:hypothetical protein